MDGWWVGLQAQPQIEGHDVGDSAVPACRWGTLEVYRSQADSGHMIHSMGGILILCFCFRKAQLSHVWDEGMRRHGAEANAVDSPKSDMQRATLHEPRS